MVNIEETVASRRHRSSHESDTIGEKRIKPRSMLRALRKRYDEPTEREVLRHYASESLRDESLVFSTAISFLVERVLTGERLTFFVVLAR